MAIKYLLPFCIIALAHLSCSSTASANPSHYSTTLNRSCFPAGFIFGAGSAAYQSEGGAHIDGRGPSIWDTFTKNHPEKISDGSTGEVADDFYHRYKGKISGGLNPVGVTFYNNLINELIANGIMPFVTIFHWDLPQSLEDNYGGFLSSLIVKDFEDYADFCFKTFGDRVQNWVTLNEPYTFSAKGYNDGTTAPGRCSNYIGNCTSGNSATEPYIVAHNLLLSHAAAVKVYKQKYQAYQKGQIGITLIIRWMIPKTKSAADLKAASKSLDFMFGWFADPVTFGDYPKIMRSLVGNRLPKFNKTQSKTLKGSFDFLGVNYYTTNYAANSLINNNVNKSYSTDSQVTLTTQKNGIPIGTPTSLSWLFVYPKGIQSLILYIRDKYKNPFIYITENGVGDAHNASLSIEHARQDGFRIRYHHDHLSYLIKAIKEGVKVKGYYAWSFFDDFEWGSGYTVRFGMVYIDFKNNLDRYLKYSAYWFKMFLLH